MEAICTTTVNIIYAKQSLEFQKLKIFKDIKNKEVNFFTSGIKVQGRDNLQKKE